MFGQDLAALLKDKGYLVIETDIHNMDITKYDDVNTFFQNNTCDAVIHGAAYTNVDGAESDLQTAFLINETGTENIAKITGDLELPLVYISTDYVFDGTNNTPYEPNDKTNPQSVYGKSKLAGEIAVQKYNPKHYITRTSWLYGHKGKNFVETIIKLGQEKPELKVVDDQKGCPTWTVDLAGAVIKILEEIYPYGIYHACGSGETTWHGFTKKIFQLMDIKIPVLPVTTDEFPRPAKRPAYSVMNNEGICQHWEKAIEQYIKIRSEE
ncbi:MAG: dTDP-4-dehydrorhamnose reductase [Candidatus Melainabacteria bacterium GWF2_32_7]|nr:MAG: dTDP-4-dehydrorhamnose reductase [Candidatus Melainabacteria bacterium GWF2_32_7]